MGFFSPDGQGGYQSEPGKFAFSTLSGNWTNGFTLTGTDGVQEIFDASGRLVSRTDHDGNTTTYSYTSGYLTSVIDADHHTTTYTYSGNRVSQITDFAGRTTTLGYDASGRLTSITQPDPGDGSPVTYFGYDSATGLMNSTADADGNETGFAYDFARTLHTVAQPDENEVTYQAWQVTSLPGVATQSNPASLVDVSTVHASSWDQLSHLTEYTFDRFGLATSITDAENHVTTLTRDSNGLVTQIVGPNPGDGAPTVTYHYDSRGNLTEEDLPDGSQELWTYQTFSTYGGSLDQITSYTDDVLLPTPLTDVTHDVRAYLTLYTVDSSTGDILSVRQVVGQVDGQGNNETDDVVTGYTYTQHSSNSADPPAGLVATMTDPDGNETAYQYNAHGLLTQTTYAVGTDVQASTENAYDTADNLVTATNELGYQTTYTYDALGRKTSMTQPADSNGDHPVTSYEYDAMGMPVQETDPLGRVTAWTYDDMGRVYQTTKPGPDNGMMPTVTTTTYTATGLLASQSDSMGCTTSYAYDDLGRQTSVTGPAPDPVNNPTVRPVTSYEYDALGRVTQKTDPLGT